MNREEICEVLSGNPGMRDKLYARGFLLTDASVDLMEYPFFGRWREAGFGKYRIISADKTNCCVQSRGEVSAAIVGHAYNPFTMEYREDEILNSLMEALETGEQRFFDSFNELTGVFTFFLIRDSCLFFAGDASGMQTTYYSAYRGHCYISSHSCLIGDLLSLKTDDYVQRLTGYRFYPLLGNSLPGDLSPFAEVHRLVPNHYVCVRKEGLLTKRFYYPVSLHKTAARAAEETAPLMQAAMRLISRKWERPAISLTGGCDSRTTLACARDDYDRFRYFSYVSSESEAVDAEAAAKLCRALGLRHTTYHIPERDDELPGVPAAREILHRNTGNVSFSNKNDVRKRVFFADTDDFDVEVKSWASEIGRSYYSKRFHGRTGFGPEPTPRKCTTLYKFFLHDRRLVRETDAIFRSYLEKFFMQDKVNPIEWQEQFFWEFRVPAWNGLVITGEHRYSFDITIPYNNRKILELLLSVPIEDRIHDNVYREIRNLLDPRIDATGISVTNLKHTEKREIAENLYYTIHSRMVF